MLFRFLSFASPPHLPKGLLEPSIFKSTAKSNVESKRPNSSNERQLISDSGDENSSFKVENSDMKDSNSFYRMIAPLNGSKLGQKKQVLSSNVEVVDQNSKKENLNGQGMGTNSDLDQSQIEEELVLETDKVGEFNNSLIESQTVIEGVNKDFNKDRSTEKYSSTVFKDENESVSSHALISSTISVCTEYSSPKFDEHKGRCLKFNSIEMKCELCVDGF
ncbi:unnamed protein product, partial [Rotaria magnacalcarata]